MNAVDWVIVAVTLLMALSGYSRGLLVGAASLVGFVIGALVGSRIAPLLLSQGSRSPYASLLALGGALLVGTLLGGLFEGVARRLRRLLWFPPLRLADGIGGAILTGCIGLGVAWIAGAALQQSATGFSLPIGLRNDLRKSVILRDLDRVLPPSGSILHALASVDPLPSLNGRVTNVPAPNPKILRAAGVRRAAASVVRITGTACGLGVEGSGWVAGAGLVVTNAHVVAGEDDTSVQLRGSGIKRPAEVLVFDPHNDIAVLRVRGLSAPALKLVAEQPAAGTPGAILGFPLDGGYDRQPARLGSTAYTATQNAYGNPALRDISAVRGLVRPGNSGGPLVGRAGNVIGTIFAEITDTPKGEPAGYAIPDSVVSGELVKARAAVRTVSTESCAD